MKHHHNLKRLQSIRCYRGLRHQRGLPVRGQKEPSPMQELAKVEENRGCGQKSLSIFK